MVTPANGRPASLVATCDQWLRATHHLTAVEGGHGELLLRWTPADPVEAPPGGCLARGLATDRLCRIHLLSATTVERLAVGPTARGVDYAALPQPVVVVGGEAGTATTAPSGPDFSTAGPGPQSDLVGIAIDDDDRLALADRGTRSISILDLWSRRLLRTIGVATTTHPDRHPMGLASRGDLMFGVLRRPAGLIRFTATRGPEEIDLPPAAASAPADAEPARVAVLADGTPVVLLHDDAGGAWLASVGRPLLDVGPTSDVAVDPEGAVVVAPCPSPSGGATLRRFAPTSRGWNPVPPLDASGYDGRGLVVTRDGRVGYTTPSGFRLAVAGAVSYASEGECTTFRLDSGTPANRWGRILVEACIPDGTACLVAAATADDDLATEVLHEDALPAADCPTAPVASPPLPPRRLVPVVLEQGRDGGRLHERPDAVTPWWRRDERFRTYEAPVMAPPGRYLWVTLRLTGDQRRTPRVRELRVEHTSHALLRRLPAVFSAEERQAEFLQRYLATFDGFLHDLDLRSRARDILVDPFGTPAEALDWLASFLGLVLDDRWAEAARRRLVSEIVPLYRRRGTVWALGRYIAIYLASDRAGGDDDLWVEPVIVEHFRLRGAGGLLGDDASLSSRSVLGAGFRVGGEVGALGKRPLDPDEPAGSAFATHAHRFTVLVPQTLDVEQEAVVRHVLDTERPAHTAYELCTVEAGMRAGRGLHVGLSSIVGPTGAFEPVLAGRSWLGRDGILGGRSTGLAVEAGRVGTTARVG